MAAMVAVIAAIQDVRGVAAWGAIFAGQDCCCSVVATVAEAMADTHFITCALSAGGAANSQGTRLLPPGGGCAEAASLRA